METSLFKEDIHEPPMFLPVIDSSGREVGVAVVYYDNYIIISKCRNTTRMMNKRLLRNFKLFSIAVKEHQCILKEDFLSGSRVDTLGIQFGLSESQDANENQKRSRATLTMEWKLSGNLGSSPLPFESSRFLFSCKELAKPIGKIIFSRYLEGPLGRIKDVRLVLDVLRRIGRTAYSAGWSKICFRPSTDDIAVIEREWLHVLENPIRTTELQKKTNFFVASDASMSGWGFVIMTTNGMVIVNSGLQSFPPGWEERHIFVKEMYAACEGFKALRGLQLTGRYCIVTDNTATAWALRRGYSANIEAMKLMDASGICGSSIEVITVISQDNVADSPSRGAPLEETRINATTAAVNEYRRGRVTASVPILRGTRIERKELTLQANDIDSDEDEMTSEEQWWPLVDEFTEKDVIDVDTEEVPIV